MDWLIRPETASDHSYVAEVHRRAFGQDNEARLVEMLRRSQAYTAELSLVGEVTKQIVGHILFSPIVIRSTERDFPALALAPMAVLPGYQRRGIGSALVRSGLARCRELGWSRVIVAGHAEYYPRFGFVPASTKGVRAPFAVPDEAFMLIELAPEACNDCAGVVEYPSAFSEV